MLPSLFLLASALSFFACGDKKPPAVSISPSVLEAKESPLSLLPMQYDSKLNPDQYATIEAATEIPLLRWDFSEELSTTYQFSQQATSTSRYNLSAEAPESNIQKITATGIIKIQSTGDSQAELSILDLQTTMHLGSTDDPQEISQTMTPIILQGFQEDSHLSAQLSASSGGMDLLFRLPKTKLKLGESISIPVETPFNAMGSLLMVKGETTITLHQWVTIADQLCIQMQIQTVVDQLDIPFMIVFSLGSQHLQVIDDTKL